MTKTQLALGAVLLTLALSPLHAEEAIAPESKIQTPAAALAPPALPANNTTHHDLVLPGRVLHVDATAGSLRLTDSKTNAALADVAFISFQMPPEPGQQRPVTFLYNGGPGYASGWLNLGGVGPWRLPMFGDAAAPSAAPQLINNPDTWLDFTDLVFLDPPGTGYSRVLGGKDVQREFWSEKGDVNALAVTIRRWSEANNRMTSPKFLAGESYGGFRSPKIAHVLQVDQGVGVNIPTKSI